MAPKKKKGSKKKKKGAAVKKVVDENPDPASERPEYKCPINDAPIATIKVKLATPFNPFLESEVKMRVSWKLHYLQQKIKALHGGSIGNIKICFHSYDANNAHTDPSLSLRDIGIATEGPFNCYYDFPVVPRPLLTTPLNYSLDY